MKFKTKFASAMLATAMASGLMTLPVFAADVPSATDTATVTVYDVEKGVTVTAYQIVDAVYGTNGLTNYAAVTGVTIADVTAPTAAEVTAIAQNINNGTVALNSKALTYSDTASTYTAELEAGSYIVLVSDSNATVYNPLIVSVTYTDSNDKTSISGGIVYANGGYVINGTTAYAKSSTPTVNKSIVETTSTGTNYLNGDDQNIGDVVTFQIATTIPDYSDEYTEPVFTITDTMSDGLVAVNDATAYKVTVGETVAVLGTNYTVKIDGQTTTIAFDSDYIKANGGKSVTIQYYTTIDTDAVYNGNANPNEVVLEYTNDWDFEKGFTTETDDDEVYLYTFALTDELNKVSTGGSATASGDKVTVTKPLADAEFTIYTDAECTKVYTNTLETDGVYVTEEDGNIKFQGLEEGTYYITETKAPEKYSINPTVYKVEIGATYDTAGKMTEYTINVTDMTANKTYTNTYTVGTDSTTGEIVITADQNPVAIVDSTLAALPSTGGMGLYVVMGTSILVLAAGAFYVLRKKELN